MLTPTLHTSLLLYKNANLQQNNRDTMKEDDLVNALIKSRRANFGENVKLHVEPHYNYYGDRGIADLYERRTDDNAYGRTRRGFLYEIKGDAAIESATGANEIIRQFNRMTTYFFKDESWNPPEQLIVFRLLFLPTQTAVEHLSSNQAMYKEVMNKTPDFESRAKLNTKVEIGIQHPESNFPLRLFRSGGDDNIREELEASFPNCLDALGDDLVEFLDE